MADKTFKKNKTRETTDPNLNDFEINDNSAKDNFITLTRINCINGNLGNNDEFSVPLEILEHDNKETQTKNCEYVQRFWIHFTRTILISSSISMTFLTYLC